MKPDGRKVGDEIGCAIRERYGAEIGYTIAEGDSSCGDSA
jgi:hypothetical protein